MCSLDGETAIGEAAEARWELKKGREKECQDRGRGSSAL